MASILSRPQCVSVDHVIQTWKQVQVRIYLFQQWFAGAEIYPMSVSTKQYVALVLPMLATSHHIFVSDQGQVFTNKDNLNKHRTYKNVLFAFVV